ncbi:MAG: transporter substrate-binding protein [Paenibacillus sp.]|nr:transporter substrate-binding protein [Paenibacillus sp.]
MKNSKKLFVAAVMSVALAASGCSGDTGKTVGSEETPKNNSAPKTQVKLKWWGGVPEESGPGDVVLAWNKQNPDIQVEYVRYVNDDAGNTKLDTALLSQSDAPDIVVSHSDTALSKRHKAGMLEPLDEFIDKQKFNVASIIGIENINKFDGKVYYLPGSTGMNGVLFNKNALDEIGEKVPTSWTWNDFAVLATKLNKPDRKGAFVSPSFDPIATYVLSMSKPIDPFFSSDGMSNFNHPAVQKGLELQKDLQDKGVMVKWSEAIANKLSPQNELLTNKAAMVYGGTYMVRYLKDLKSFPRDFVVAFAPEPQFEKGTNINLAGLGDFMSINKLSPNKDASFKFIAWYLTEGNMHLVSGGRIPSNKTADMEKLTAQLIGETNNKIDQESLKNLLKGNYTFVKRTNVKALPELNKIFKEEAEKFMMNVQPLDQTMSKLKSRADEVIKSTAK